MNFIERIGTFLGADLKKILADRQSEINRTLAELPLTNATIWWGISNHVSLSEAMQKAIIDSYCTYHRFFPEYPVTAAELLMQSEIKKEPDDLFLEKVSFNYDLGLNAPKALAEAFKELKEGKRGEVDANEMAFVSLEEGVSGDIRLLEGESGIYYKNRFLSHSDIREHIVKKVIPLLEIDERIKAGTSFRRFDDTESIGSQIVRIV